MKQKPGPKPLPPGMKYNRRPNPSINEAQLKVYWIKGGHDWFRGELDKELDKLEKDEHHD